MGTTPVVTCKSCSTSIPFDFLIHFQERIVFESQGLPVYGDFFVPVKLFKGSLVISALSTIFTYKYWLHVCLETVLNVYVMLTGRYSMQFYKMTFVTFKFT